MSDLNQESLQPMLRPKVLIVSDDYESARIWCTILNERNFNTKLLSSPGEALQAWMEMIPELIVIDAHTSEFDAVNLVSQLRENGIVPILLLTPVSNETHILNAYQAGVDECAVKPISPSLFLAKVKAMLRRAWSLPAESLDSFRQGGLRLEPNRRQVITEEEQVINLTNLEFRLLHLLMTHPGWVFTTEDIVQKVWGYHGNGDSNLLKNVVYRLRRKIDPDPVHPRYIHTEAGIGYKYQDTWK